MIFLFFISFITLVVLLTYLDKKLWGTIYTPAIVLVWPFLILLIIDSFYLKSNFTYFRLNQNVILIWFFGILVFWVAGLLVKLSFKDIKVSKLQLETYGNNITISKSKLCLLFYISYPLIFICIFKIYTIASSFGFNFGDDNFQDNLGKGFIAHSILLLILISIFLIIFFNKSYYKALQIGIIVITLIFSVLYAVKSWIIIPLISSFIGRLLLKKTKLKFSHLIVFISPFLIFWLIYKISLGFESSNDEFIFQHMIDYLLSGPIAFSEHLNQNLPIGTEPGYAFTPLINIFRFLIGEKPLSPISNYYVTISTGFEPNVKTFFGTLYIYGGLSYILTSFLLGIMFYSYLLVFCYSLNSQSTPFVTSLYVFMLGLLFMGWFDSYVIHLSLYEIPFWVLLLHFLFKIKNS
ncbi:DUF6337 family protein [Flavobacterium sp. M31R6]|uniref:DUF6337 family protein n=1 Tax=Flavobacterium sp. M31R6 TaxID=2739062 RepID=UPI00156A51F3|nr:DUF6337 family protein [Flavobacterium sp. M31R6]QKJ64821.1 oligosaccharide repeat unit polymerase [Flavobacterium sp. M31R6]